MSYVRLFKWSFHRRVRYIPQAFPGTPPCNIRHTYIVWILTGRGVWKRSLTRDNNRADVRAVRPQRCRGNETRGGTASTGHELDQLFPVSRPLQKPELALATAVQGVYPQSLLLVSVTIHSLCPSAVRGLACSLTVCVGSTLLCRTFLLLCTPSAPFH